MHGLLLSKAISEFLFNKWNNSLKADVQWLKRYADAIAQIKANEAHYEQWRKIQGWFCVIIWFPMYFSSMIAAANFFENKPYIAIFLIIISLFGTVCFAAFMSESLILLVYKLLNPQRNSSLLGFNSPIQNPARSYYKFTAPRYDFFVSNTRLFIITSAIFLLSWAVGFWLK